jgi:hypothetical protein
MTIDISLYRYLAASSRSQYVLSASLRALEEQRRTANGSKAGDEVKKRKHALSLAPDADNGDARRSEFEVERHYEEDVCKRVSPQYPTVHGCTMQQNIQKG